GKLQSESFLTKWCGRRDLNSCVAPFCFPLIPHDCNDLAVLVVFANTSLNGCLDAYIISMVALWLRILQKLVAPRSCLYGLGYKCFVEHAKPWFCMRH